MNKENKRPKKEHSKVTNKTNNKLDEQYTK